jgi:hypothetical protein
MLSSRKIEAKIHTCTFQRFTAVNWMWTVFLFCSFVNVGSAIFVPLKVLSSPIDKSNKSLLVKNPSADTKSDLEDLGLTNYSFIHQYLSEKASLSNLVSSKDNLKLPILTLNKIEQLIAENKSLFNEKLKIKVSETINFSFETRDLNLNPYKLLPHLVSKETKLSILISHGIDKLLDEKEFLEDTKIEKDLSETTNFHFDKENLKARDQFSIQSSVSQEMKLFTPISNVNSNKLLIDRCKAEVNASMEGSQMNDSSSEQEYWEAQASPPSLDSQPVNSSVTPELQRLQKDFLIQISPSLSSVIVAPSASISTPLGFGASFGQIYGGVGFQARTRFRQRADGGLSLGAGLGDPRKFLGVDATVSILSLTGNDAFDRGGISFKIHRSLTENFAIAVGVENAIGWGFTDSGSSVYGVVSKFFHLKDNTDEPFSQLTLSLGLGGGRFRSENDIINGVDSVGVFSSIGVRVIEPMSFVAEWSGQDLNMGISLIPFDNLPLTINLAGADWTGNAGDGTRFIMSIGYNYFFPR